MEKSNVRSLNIGNINYKEQQMIILLKSEN